MRKAIDIRTHPESTGSECNHAATEAWLLARRCDTLVHAFAQPHVRLHVPRVKEHLEIRRELDIQDVDVRGVMPKRLSARPKSGETVASFYARALRQSPDGVVLRALEEAAELEENKPIEIV